MRQLCHCLLLVCGIALVSPHSTSSIAASQESAPQTAAQPTAADMALLLNKMDAPAVETVRSAIGASDQMVRTVAARIAAVTAHPPFANVLAMALGSEQDPAAAREQVRALLSIRGLQAAETVEARLGAMPAVAEAYSEWLASTQPDRFVELLPKLASALGEKRTGWSKDVGTALDKRPELAEGLLRAWLDVSTVDEWSTSLDAIHRQARPGQERVLIEAVTNAKPEIREKTIWNIVERLAGNETVSLDLLDAIAPATPPASATDSTSVTWEQFGRELIARRHRAARTPDRSTFLAAEAAKRTFDAIEVARLTQTLETERKVLKGILGGRFPKEQSSIPPPMVGRHGPTMRTIPVPWPGFVKQVLDASKCTPGKSPVFGAAYAIYRPNGTVAQVQLTPLPVPPGCEPALTVLARLTLMDFGYQPRAGEGELLVLPLGREAVDCTHDASQYVSKPTSISIGTDNQGRRIIAPRKTRDVRPEYPPAMMERRVQGLVVLESTISQTGCVTNLKVKSSVSPALDLAALRAISQWQFTSTTLDGQPVPVIMTVSVNFKLP